MVIGGGGSNRKVVSFVSVPLSVNSVQSKGHDRQNVGLQGRTRPCGVNLTGSHIFNVVFIAHIIVLGGLVSNSSVVDNDEFRDHYPAKYDLTGFIDWLDLIFCNFRRIIPPEGMRAYDYIIKCCSCSFQGNHGNILKTVCICQNLSSRDRYRLIAGCCHMQIIF